MNGASQIPGYVEVEQIGAGGFGRVYRARQPAFDRTVAIKILDGPLDDAATLRRFRRECQAVGAVSSHPNIVPVYDAGTTPDGRPYLVMDYVAGGSLADRLARSGPLPWAEVVSIGVKISGALATAHAAGILHRDIKPENILVSQYGEPQLADFGIAQRGGADNRTTTSTAMTPSHTAPEQFAGSPPSQSTDVYALASTLFTLLAARTPFQGNRGESVFALMARASTSPVPDLRPFGVPDPVALAIEHGLAKDPAARPPSAVAFGELLQTAQHRTHLPVTLLPVARDTAASAAAATVPMGPTPPLPPVPFPPTAVAPGFPPPPPGAVPPGAAFPAGTAFPTGTALPTGTGGTAGTGGSGGERPRRGGGRGAWIAAAVVVIAVVAVVSAVLLRGHRSSSDHADITTSTTRTTTGTTTAPPTSSAPTSASTNAATTSTAGGTTSSTSGSPTTTSGDDGLQARLLQAGETPLTTWTTVDPSLIPIPVTTEYFCHKTIDTAGAPSASVTMADTGTSHIFVQQLFRPGEAGATTMLGQVRASASCGSWTEDGQQETVAPGDPISVGDDAVAYLSGSAEAQVYQVFFRKGAYLCVITVAVWNGSAGSGDRSLAAAAATAAAGRLS